MNKDIYISKDINGINCGVFLLRKSNLVISLLHAALNLSDKYLNHIWWEQAAIIELIDSNFLGVQTYIEYVPQSLLNAYDMKYVKTHDEGYVNDKSFILHLPSLDNSARYNILADYRKRYYGS